MILSYFPLFTVLMFQKWSERWLAKDISVNTLIAIKQTQVIFFIKKVSKPFLPDVYFNNNTVNSTSFHKHFRMIVDFKSSCEEHLKSVLAKVNESIRLIIKFRLNLLWWRNLWLSLQWIHSIKNSGLI